MHEHHGSGDLVARRRDLPAVRAAASPTATATGIGDLAGVRARLPYLAGARHRRASGSTPWYPSPMADAGYDVADYRDIDPAFGTLADADALIAEAHALGIRIDHRRRARTTAPTGTRGSRPRWPPRPGSAERARFWFRPGRGPDGDLPPNNWQSHLRRSRLDPGHRAGRHARASGTCTCSPREQPDFNWANPEVRAEFEAVLRFWFDRGVDGIRIDSAALLVKDPLLPDHRTRRPGPHPYTDRDGVHEIYRDWRAVADSLPGDRVLIGEVWLAGRRTGCARYLRPDELHTAFNFPFLLLRLGRRARCARSSTARWPSTPPVGAPPTWVLSNHDVDPARDPLRPRRHLASTCDRRDHSQPVDLELGTRRARAAALLTMALPGSVYLYQGEELGLWEVEDIPDELPPGPDLAPHRRRRPRPRRLPGPAALGGPGAAVRLHAAGRRRAALAARSPRTWRELHRRGRRPATRTRCSSSTAPRCGSAAPSPLSATGPMHWLPSARRGARLRPRRPALRGQPLRPYRSPCPPTPPCSWPAAPSATGCSAPTPPPGSASRDADVSRSRGTCICDRRRRWCPPAQLQARQSLLDLYGPLYYLR